MNTSREGTKPHHPRSTSILVVSHSVCNGVGQAFRHAVVPELLSLSLGSGIQPEIHLHVPEASLGIDGPSVETADLLVLDGTLPVGVPDGTIAIMSDSKPVALTWLDAALTALASGTPVFVHDLVLHRSPPQWLVPYMALLFTEAVRVTSSSESSLAYLRERGVHETVSTVPSSLPNVDPPRVDPDGLLARLSLDRGRYMLVDRSCGRAHRFLGPVATSTRPELERIDLMMRGGTVAARSSGGDLTVIGPGELKVLVEHAALMISDSRALEALAHGFGIPCVAGRQFDSTGPDEDPIDRISGIMTRPVSKPDSPREGLDPMDIPARRAPDPLGALLPPWMLVSEDRLRRGHVYDGVRQRQIIRTLSAQADELKSSLKDSNKAQRRLVTRLEKAQESRKAAEEQHARYRRDIRRRDERLHEVNIRARTLKGELDAARSRTVDLERKATDLERERAALDQKLRTVSGKLERLSNRRSVKLVLALAELPKRARRAFSTRSRQ